jgi:myo-inositol-1(or 4)-monophosphatase
MIDPQLSKPFAFAKRIVRAAGINIARMQRRARVRARKHDGDLATDGDIAAERFILTRLMRQFPDHGFISEERGQHKPNAQYVWVLDPIDGTKYYAGGIPLYGISLALRWKGEYVLGVVGVPACRQVFAARAGNGATMNGHKLTWRPAVDITQATICLEIPSRRAPAAVRRLAWKRTQKLLDHAFRVRIIGVSSLGLCFGAAGAFDAYLNLNTDPDPVDYAGGWAIAREAGAQVEFMGPHILAARPALCRQIRRLLGPVGP